MIARLRQYLLTLVVLATGFVWGWPIVLTVVSGVAASLVDAFVTSRSTELTLYHKGLEFGSPTTRRLSLGKAIRLQILAAIASTMIALIPRVVGSEQLVQLSFGMASLIISGAAASYCGFRIVPGLSVAPKELLTNLDSHGSSDLWPFDLLPGRVRRTSAALFRIAGGVIFLLPFALLLGAIETLPLSTTAPFFVLGLAVFFQLGFLLLSQALFSLRWWRRDTGNRP